MTNNIKVEIDDTKQNNKSRFYGNRDETVNHIISKCSKLAQKEYKTRHNWIPLGIVPGIKIWPYYWMVHALNYNPTYKMRCMKFSGILRFKGIT